MDLVNSKVANVFALLSTPISLLQKEQGFSRISSSEESFLYQADQSLST